MLLQRQLANKRKDKFSPNKRGHTNVRKLTNMISNNQRYLSVPHGIPEHLKKSTDKASIDRNKIYSMRSNNPMVIPSRITDIPA